MKAVVFKNVGEIGLEERPLPRLREPGDALVRVTLTTICSSDIHIKRGAVPRAVPGTILGHEFVGVVEQVGPGVRRFAPGDRVAVNVETYCGNCFFCSRGYVNNCTDPQGGWALGCRIDGGQAEYVRIPYADNGLTRIPDGVSDEAALFTGDLLSTGFWGARLGEIRPGDTVAVIGAGPAGLCSMMCAKLYGPARVIAVDVDPYRLRLAKENGLADVALNPLECDVKGRVLALTEGRGADCVMEVAGQSQTFDLAWQIARPNAVVCVIAMYEENQTLPLPEMYGKNLVFKTGGVDGCHCGEIMDLIAAGTLDTSCMITHRTDLEHIMEAYRVFEEREDHVIKYAVRVSHES